MAADNQLGELLRARREALHPADLGLPPGDRARRVRGLRREEVAVLAGISAEYYVRLEQGRERRPSAQVVAALSRALHLDSASANFIRHLAGLSADHREPTATGDLEAFIGALTSTPAFVHDRILQVVAANRLARAVSPSFRPGVNLLRAAFLDPQLEALYVNHDEMRARLVAYLRVQAAAPPADPRLSPLVDEMKRSSAEFAALWSRIDVTPASSGLNRLQHPVVGAFELWFERLCFAGSEDPVVLIYHATPGTASAAALASLAAAAAGEDGAGA